MTKDFMSLQYFRLSSSLRLSYNNLIVTSKLLHVFFIIRFLGRK